MTLRNGKFYDNLLNVVPLQHGNKEQYKLLEKAKELATKDGIMVIDFFTCICGENRTYIEDLKFKCPCGIKYEFYAWRDDYGTEIPSVRMTKK